MDEVSIGGQQQRGSKVKNLLALIAEHADIMDVSKRGVKDKPPFEELTNYLLELKWRETLIDGVPEADRSKAVDNRIYSFLNAWADKAVQTQIKSCGTKRAELKYDSTCLPKI